VQLPEQRRRQDRGQAELSGALASKQWDIFLVSGGPGEGRDFCIVSSAEIVDRAIALKGGWLYCGSTDIAVSGKFLNRGRVPFTFAIELVFASPI
jgi:hypothetical protein